MQRHAVQQDRGTVAIVRPLKISLGTTTMDQIRIFSAHEFGLKSCHELQ
jgi:hypothetical protein